VEKQINKQTEERRQQNQYQKKRTKGLSLECNSNNNNNNNSIGTDGRRHSVDDEAELVQNDEISKTIVIT
jgi:hypothetical protein